MEVYEEQKYSFVLIITIAMHVKKNRSLEPGKLEVLFTTVKVHLIANIGRKVMSRVVCHTFQIDQGLSEKFGILQNTKFGFLLKQKVYEIRLFVKDQHSFF